MAVRRKPSRKNKKPRRGDEIFSKKKKRKVSKSRGASVSSGKPRKIKSKKRVALGKKKSRFSPKVPKKRPLKKPKAVSSKRKRLVKPKSKPSKKPVKRPVKKKVKAKAKAKPVRRRPKSKFELGTEYETLGERRQRLRREIRHQQESVTKRRLIFEPIEVLRDRLEDFHNKQDKKGKIKPPYPGKGFNSSWKYKGPSRRGCLRSKRLRVVLTENSMVSVVRNIMRVAIALRGKCPRGDFFASFSLFEYGREIFGSALPQNKIKSDKNGNFYNSFDSTTGAATLQGFQVQIERMLEEMISHPRSAILLDSVVVKIYEEI